MSSKMMPSALQRLADAVMEGNHYRDTVPLWGYLCKHQAALASDIEKFSSKGSSAAPGKLVPRLEKAMKEMRSAKKRGTWKPARDMAPANTAPVRGQPAKKQEQPISSRTCVGAEEMLWMTTDEVGENQDPAPRFDVEDTTEESTGYAIGQAAVVARFLDLFLRADKFANPCALICNKSNFDSLMATHNRDVVKRFSPSEVTLFFSTAKGAPLPESCIMFQMGEEHVVFHDRAAQAHTTGDLADSITVSVQIPDITNAPDFNKDIKSNFKKAALALLGPKLMYKEEVPFHTGTHEKIWKNNTVVQKHIGLAKVQASKIDEVWKKSGQAGVEIKAMGREKFYHLPLYGTSTWAEARAKAAPLGGLAYGVVTTKGGFAVRVYPEKQVEAEKLLDPAYAELLGDDLMTLSKFDGVQLRITGVPRNMNDTTLVEKLTLDTLQGKWKCKPKGTEKCVTPGKKTILAQARTPPPRVNVRVFLADGESTMIHIETTETPTRRLTQWDKIGKDDLPRKSMNPRPTAPSAWDHGAPSARKIPTSTATAKETRASWVQQTEEEDEAEYEQFVREVMVPPRAQDEDMDNSACSSAPAATKRLTPFMERIAEINKKNEQAAKESEAKHIKAQQQFDEFKNDMAEQLTYLGDTFAVLSDKFQKTEERLAAQADSLADITTQLSRVTAFIMQHELVQPTAPAQDSWGASGWNNTDGTWSSGNWGNQYHPQAPADASESNVEAEEDNDRERTPRGHTRSTS